MRKAQGAKLGNRTNPADAAAIGRQVQVAEAVLFAANVPPIIDSIRAAGVTDLRGIALALTLAVCGRPVVANGTLVPVTIADLPPIAAARRRLGLSVQDVACAAFTSTRPLLFSI